MAGVTERRVGAVGQGGVGQQLGHLLEAPERPRDRQSAGAKPIRRSSVGLQVVELVVDRLLVGDALRVHALSEQRGDPLRRQSLPVTATEDATGCEQPPALVQCVVAVPNVEPGVGERRRVRPYRRSNPWGSWGDDRRTGEHEGADRRRMIVPGEVRAPRSAWVVTHPIAQENEATTAVFHIAGDPPCLEQVPQEPEAVVLELPVAVVEWVLGPRGVARQTSRPMAGKHERAVQQLVGALDGIGTLATVGTEIGGHGRRGRCGGSRGRDDAGQGANANQH